MSAVVMDDVRSLGAVMNEIRLPPHPVDRHGPRVAADALRDLALLIGEIGHVEEFRAERFDLLLHRRAHVGRFDHRPQALRRGIACSPATPAPRTSTRAAFTVPAAVMSMGMKRPYSFAATITAL